jgi:hypothetical protein
MSLYLSDSERAFINRERRVGMAAKLFRSMGARAHKRAEAPGLYARGDTQEWWHLVEETVADAAMVHAVEPAEPLSNWLRDVVLSIVRRPARDWVGPWFRDHARNPPEAQLETAHVARAVAVSLDLAAELFNRVEQDEIRSCLSERVIPMSLRYLEREEQMHNHWCIIASGLAVAAAVTGDRDALVRAGDAYAIYCQAYQPDGTYAESLQYGNYATLNMMTAYESIRRFDATMCKALPPIPYVGIARWAAHAHLYLKPLSGWGAAPKPRSINFGDSAAVFVPSAEVLLHIAGPANTSDPTSAALARWLYDTVVEASLDSTPGDRASFGFVNQPGWLSLPLLASARDAASPETLNEPLLHAFGCGDAIARDAWAGKTVLAMRTGGEPMHIVSHVHGDANAIQLTHNRERLLVDPGHSCYRSLVHELEISTHTHNTCVFDVDAPTARTLVQRGFENRRRLDRNTMAPVLPAFAKRLLTAESGDLRIVAADAAPRYGDPIRQFRRLIILCGSHALFVVDWVKSDTPVRTRWNWLLNNRDFSGDLKVIGRDRLIFRRGDAGMQIFHRSGSQFGGPQYAFVHDAYHPLPNQLGEGAVGSGLLVHWRDTVATTRRVAVHAVAVDDSARIESWSCAGTSKDVSLIGRDGAIGWRVHVETSSNTVTVSDTTNSRAWRIDTASDDAWTLAQTH